MCVLQGFQQVTGEGCGGFFGDPVLLDRGGRRYFHGIGTVAVPNGQQRRIARSKQEIHLSKMPPRQSKRVHDEEHGNAIRPFAWQNKDISSAIGRFRRGTIMIWRNRGNRCSDAPGGWMRHYFCQWRLHIKYVCDNSACAWMVVKVTVFGFGFPRPNDNELIIRVWFQQLFQTRADAS